MQIVAFNKLKRKQLSRQKHNQQKLVLQCAGISVKWESARAVTTVSFCTKVPN